MTFFLRRAALAAVAFLVGISLARAQLFPSRPIALVVPYATGGASDIIARVLAERLQGPLGQPVVVENRPGANTVTATQYVAGARADGYTLLSPTNAHTINAALQPLPFDPVADFEPVILLVKLPLVVVVHPGVPATTLPELLALAKSKPGSLNFGSSGSGSPAHLAGELLKARAQIDIVHVPYRGAGPAMNDLLGGQIQLLLNGLPNTLPHIRAGKVRALAITGSERSGLAPEIPTVSELGFPGYEAGTWAAVLAPKATPRPVVDRLNAEMNRILNEPQVRQRIIDLGFMPIGGTPEQLGTTIRNEVEQWRRLVRDFKIKVD